MITEDQLEQLCLDWFKTIGYDYVCDFELSFVMGIVLRDTLLKKLLSGELTLDNSKTTTEAVA